MSRILGASYQRTHQATHQQTREHHQAHQTNNNYLATGPCRHWWTLQLRTNSQERY